MALRVVRLHTLECDGCKQRFGADAHYDSAVEVRGVAYTQGWRFPPKVTMNGGRSSNSSDVCPKCVQGWEPQPTYDTWKRRRATPSGDAVT